MDHQRFGRLVRLLRRERKLTQERLALLAHINQSEISRIENGAPCPSTNVRRLDSALDAGGILIQAAHIIAERAAGPESVQTGPPYAMLAGGLAEEVSQTERRDVLGIGIGSIAAAGMARSALSGPGLLRHSLEKGSVSPQTLTWVEHETSQLAYLGTRVSGIDRLLPEATELFDHIAGLLGEPQRTPDRIRLTRCAANLAGVIGEMTLQVRGYDRRGAAWFHASRSAALDIGDQRLADMALTGLAFNALYQGDPTGALAVLRPRLENPPAQPTEGFARLVGVAGRTHAALGNGSASARHIDNARDALDRAPEPDPGWYAFYPFGAATMEFFAANAASQLGDAPTATAAADRALELFDSTNRTNNTDRVLVRFDKADALFARGERDEACGVATAAIRDPNMYFGGLVQSRTDAFDRRLGSGGGAVADWREAYQSRRANELTA